MSFGLLTQSIFFTVIFSIIVLVIFWFEYRRVRKALLEREQQMKRRMYEISILREIGERIGYSLNVKKIVDIISGSLGSLLPYSTVAYMLPDKEEDNKLLFSVNLAEPVSKEFVKEVEVRMVKSFTALFGKKYESAYVEESITGAVTDPMDKSEVKSFFNVPIVINEKPAGILTVASKLPGLYKTGEQVEILYTIMNQASDAVSKLEQVLEIEKGKLNAMVESMADGVLMVDNKGRPIVINPTTQKMLELEADEPGIFDVYDALENKMDLRTKIEESAKKDELIIEDEIQIGDNFLQVLISPVKDKQENPLGVVVLFHDITKEKEVEKMRDDFTSMMVHELRSPLTGIRSIANLLKKDTVKNEEKKFEEFVDLISSNSTSMLDLVNDLLDVAKLEAGKFEVFKNPADLRKVITQRIDSFTSLANESKINLEQTVFDSVPAQIQMDENKISQVLNNLISNAIKFTEAGGKIVISAFGCDNKQDIAQQAAKLNLAWPGMRKGYVCKNKSVVVAVTDSGMGIPESEIGELFNKFRQVSTAKKSEKKGTGLGLVIVKGVVEAHGGRVAIFSEEGKGTTFFFTIPLEQVKKNE